ncbi:hypothetical protein Hanom_Chr06g00556171 [Helianthus anomalus]
MYVEFHAAVAGPFATNEVAVMGDVELHHISSGSCCVVVNWMLSIAGFVVGLVHFYYVVLVSVIHENCKEGNFY